MNRRLIHVVVLVLLTALLAACGGTQTNQSNEPPPPAVGGDSSAAPAASAEPSVAASASTAAASAASSTEATTASAESTAAVPDATSAAGGGGTGTLVLWDQENSVIGDQINSLIEEFEASHPGVTIERTTYAQEDLQNTLPLAMSEAGGPDIAQVNQGQSSMGRLVQAGQLLPLDQYAEQYGWTERFSQGLLDRNRFTEGAAQYGEGDLYGVSMSAEIVGVYYNKQIFQDNNISVPTTYEEFQTALQTLKDAGVTPISLGNSGSGVPGFQLVSMVQHLMVSREYIDDFVYGRNNVSFDTPENQQAAQIVQEWAKNGYFTEGYEGIGEEDMANLFATGEAAMMLSGNWWSGTVTEVSGTPENFGFFTLPPMSGTPALAIGGLGIPFGINQNSQNADLAAEFLDYLVSEEAANKLASVGQLPSAPITTSDVNPLLGDIAQAFTTTNEANAIGHYIDTAAPTLFDELGSGTQELLAERITPQEWTARIQTAYADYLASR